MSKRVIHCRNCEYFKYGGCTLHQEPVKANDCCIDWTERKREALPVDFDHQIE